MQFGALTRRAGQAGVMQVQLIFHGLVVTRGAAGLAIHEPVRTHSDVQLGLTENAEFLAIAARLALLTLRANDAARGLGGHAFSVGRHVEEKNVTKVTEKQVSGERSQVPGLRKTTLPHPPP